MCKKLFDEKKEKNRQKRIDEKNRLKKRQQEICDVTDRLNNLMKIHKPTILRQI